MTTTIQAAAERQEAKRDPITPHFCVTTEELP
jgi:hypothetical protein